MNRYAIRFRALVTALNVVSNSGIIRVIGTFQYTNKEMFHNKIR